MKELVKYTHLVRACVRVVKMRKVRSLHLCI
jgi:hypothetical protein